MAYVERRQRRPGGPVTYRVRYIDPDGRERSRTFPRKAAADDFAISISHSIRAGAYIDPGAGRLTVTAYLTDWLTQQGHLRPKTRESYTTKFRTMVDPHIGHLPLGHVRPSTIRSWQTTLAASYAPASIAVIRGVVAGAFRDAIHDRRIPSSPFDGVPTVEIPHTDIVPLTVAQVQAGHAAMPPRWAAMIPVAAGSGLRPSELWGLTPDRCDFLRRSIRVDRQLAGRKGPAPVWGPPKTRAGIRTIPVGNMVIDALAAHLAQYPAAPDGLVFTTSIGTPLTRTVFGKGWRPAADAMGLRHGQGLHQLRHFYASLLIADGLSPVEVAERMGHASATETLQTYAHLFPGREDATREAIDRAFRRTAGN